MKVFAPNSTDFYKVDHASQYPKGTTLVYSNFTPRSDKLFNMTKDFDHKVVNFGIQGALKELNEMWERNFFSRPRTEACAKYKRRLDTSLGPNAVDTSRMEALWDLGYLPIEVKALPEGAKVNIRVPLFTIKNTLPEFFWVTNYLETALSSLVWKSVTNATIAYEYKKMLDRFAVATSSYPEFTMWQGHDFSARGMSGPEDAARSGAAHLAVGFTGTDTISAIDYLEVYYGANADTELIGGSVPATEHSVMCCGGKYTELDTIKRLITETYPSGIVSIVSDTWDFFNVVTNMAALLKTEILNRTPNTLGLAKVVFRPDSGDPTKIICGDPTAPYMSSEYLGAIECLWNTFGGTVNSKGFKELNPRVGLIYGDSITLQRAEAILSGLAEKGFATTNVVFGIGSFTYQHNTRDTFGCAIKATYAEVNGVGQAIFKDPVTDKGSVKKSACGLLRVEKQGNNYVLYDNQSLEEETKGELQTVFLNGKIVKETTLAEVRANVNS
jgi:nicotinamide phosphoribosyltransferase